MFDISYSHSPQLKQQVDWEESYFIYGPSCKQLLGLLSQVIILWLFLLWFQADITQFLLNLAYALSAWILSTTTQITDLLKIWKIPRVSLCG